MTSDTPHSTAQGFGPDTTERLPLPPAEHWTPAQRSAAQALIDGPRGGVYGPFVPLLQAPALLERVGALGEQLRFGGGLADRVRELLICATARHTGNQFEWTLHAPLARRAGVSADALAQLRHGARPEGLADDEQDALDLAHAQLQQHGAAEPTYQRALARFGPAGVVEIATLVGYFVMVCGVMNLARTPAMAGNTELALPGWPG